MGYRVAGDNQPAAVTAFVKPKFAVFAGGFFALNIFSGVFMEAHKASLGGEKSKRFQIKSRPTQRPSSRIMRSLSCTPLVAASKPAGGVSKAEWGGRGYETTEHGGEPALRNRRYVRAAIE